MGERIWSHALTKTEVFAAIHRYIEETRKVTLPVSGEHMLHLVWHRGGDETVYEFWSEKPDPPKPPIRWPWQRRPAPSPPQREKGGQPG